MTLPVRSMRDSDFAFVLDAWKKSYERAEAVRHADREHYRTEMTRAIRRLCSSGSVLVAYNPDDEDHLVGFACVSKAGDELHYVYVKQDFRGQGIARALLKDAPIASFTFLAPTARPRKGWRFTPRFTI